MKETVNDLDSGTATVIGFGRTETKSASSSLIKVEVDIEQKSVCKRKYRQQGRELLDSQICARKYQADTW